MSVTIPDPRFEAPELFDPGRKPVGNVVIDWSHPLARDLEVYIIFQNGIPHDLVGGSVLEIQVGGGGDAANITSLKDGVDFAGGGIQGYVHPKITFTNAQKYTFSFRVELDGGTAEGIAFGEFDTNGNFVWFNEGNNLTRRNSASANGQWTSETSFQIKTFYSMLCDNPSASSVERLYRNGVYSTSSTATDTAMVFEAIGNGYINTAYGVDGRVYDYMIHSRALSDIEIYSLAVNPYQILIPA